MKLATLKSGVLLYGANPNIYDFDMNTPFILAAYRNQRNVTKILIDYGANKNAKTYITKTSTTDILYSRRFEETADYFSRKS
ncbi:MAG: hypothetical protein ACP5PA_03815 [Elusimicrobiales bacterium]